ncbi:MAG: hypothetical protein EOO60_01400 [Hymenobacter sp.]|nr:MAG: hypothetical protein EOO60_01400 [Hymenobacter sp.]
MKNDVRAWLILGLLAGLPTSVYALDIGGGFADVFKAMAAVFKAILGLVIAIIVIRMLVKQKN